MYETFYETVASWFDASKVPKLCVQFHYLPYGLMPGIPTRKSWENWGWWILWIRLLYPHKNHLMFLKPRVFLWLLSPQK